MYIYEAMSLAVAKGMKPGEKTYIRRTTPEGWESLGVEPRTASDGCTLRSEKPQQGIDRLFGCQWHPTVDDLMADDWELIDHPNGLYRS